MEQYINLENEVREYAIKHIKDLPFHNLEHTESVVKAVQEIGRAENLTEKELSLLEIAAWFHDTGYASAGCADHEIYGVEILENFLKDKLPQVDIEVIKNCVMATRLPQTPRNHLEQVLCDADLAHLGKETFHDFSEALRKEKSSMGGNISKSQWLLMNLHFLAQHRYFTNYARDTFEPEKQERIKEIQEEADALMRKMEHKKEVKLKEKKEKKEKKAKKVKKGEKKEQKLEIAVEGESSVKLIEKNLKSRRDIETMFRVLYRTQLGLSSIADSKASILLSINSVLTSFAIGYLFRKIDEMPQLGIPSYLLALTGLISVILAVIATRPNVKDKKGMKLPKKNVNLLFFGDFVDLSLDEYQSTLEKTTQTPDDVYEKLSRDSYYLGKVLAVKYKRIRVAFNFFMVGITVSVLAFIISFAI